MSTKTTSIITLALIALALLAGAVLWNQLPDQMASHWNVNDQVDGYTSKLLGVFLMPLITLGMFALFLVVPNIDPLKANIAKFRESFNLFIVLIVAFMLYIHGLTLAWSLGHQDFKMSVHRHTVHCNWIHVEESQAQLLHRHPHSVDFIQ